MVLYYCAGIFYQICGISGLYGPSVQHKKDPSKESGFPPLSHLQQFGPGGVMWIDEHLHRRPNGAGLDACGTVEG